MDFFAWVDSLETFEKRLIANLRDAEAQTMDDALKEAHDIASGTISTAQLRREDHPYAKRHGKPRRPVLPINRQEGLFDRSWVKAGFHVLRSRLVTVAVNTVFYAGFLAKGTWKMFARPLPQEVYARIQERRERRVEDALIKTIRGK